MPPIPPASPFDPSSIEAHEVIEVTETEVACAGTNETSGHPKVYLQLGKEGRAICPYCSRQFVRKAGAKPAAAH